MDRKAAVTKMWRPDEVGTVVAVRRLSFKPRKGRRREVVVSVGQPVLKPGTKLRGPWWCPFEISGLGKPEVSSAAGEDSVQALVLALRAIEAALLARAERSGGTIDWLGELERPVFAHTFFIEAYEAAIVNLVAGLRLAQELVENPGGTTKFDELTNVLRDLTDRRGFLKGARRVQLSKRRPA